MHTASENQDYVQDPQAPTPFQPIFRVAIVGCAEKPDAAGRIKGRLYNCRQEGTHTFYCYQQLVSAVHKLLTSEYAPVSEPEGQPRSEAAAKEADHKWHSDRPDRVWCSDLSYWFFICSSYQPEDGCRGELVLPGLKRRLFFSSHEELLFLFNKYGSACIEAGMD